MRWGTVNTNQFSLGKTHFDEVQLEWNSRMTYGLKLLVELGDEIAIVAADTDNTTVDADGTIHLNGGNYGDNYSGVRNEFYICCLITDSKNNRRKDSRFDMPLTT